MMPVNQNDPLTASRTWAQAPKFCGELGQNRAKRLKNLDLFVRHRPRADIISAIREVVIL